MARIMTIRPPDSLHKQLKEMAKVRGQTLNGMALEILWYWVKSNTIDDLFDASERDQQDTA